MNLLPTEVTEHLKYHSGNTAAEMIVLTYLIHFLYNKYLIHSSSIISTHFSSSMINIQFHFSYNKYFINNK